MIVLLASFSMPRLVNEGARFDLYMIQGREGLVLPTKTTCTAANLVNNISNAC